MPYNAYDLASTSLVKTGNLTEVYLPLWWYSSGNVSVSTNTYYLINKGSTSTTVTSGGNSANKLHTLSQNWSSSQKFAFEASLYSSVSNIYAIAALWDFTSGNYVSSSQVNTTATGFTVVRSGQFTLTPGHVYGVVISTSSTPATAYLSKASLIAFLN